MSAPNPYRSLVPYPRIDRIAMTVSVLLGLIALACMFAVDFLVAQLGDLPFIRDGFPISELEMAINHARMTGIGRALAVLLAASAVTWLIWQYRAHANLRALRLGRARFSPVAGVLSWLVPVANLVLPLLAIRELWRIPDPDAVTPDGESRPPGRTSPLVWAWWAAFVATVALAVRGFLLAPIRGASAEQLIARNHWLVPACLVGIVASILAIVVVNRIIGRLHLKEDQVRSPGWVAWKGGRRTKGGSVSRG